MCPSTDPAAPLVGSSPLPAAASLGIASILEGPAVPGVVLGATSQGAWMRTKEHVLVVSDAKRTRLPNGVTVGHALESRPSPGDGCVIGDGHVELGDTSFTVVRWWDPSPSLPAVTRERLATRAALASLVLICHGCQRLESALCSRNTFAMRRSMRDLLGQGAGLTPEGDDVLIGLLAGLKLLGPAMGADWADDLVRSIEPVLLVEAPFRTTSLSVALLRHAAIGEVAAPVARFLRALTGRGPLFEAIEHLNDMGESSGAATACGVLVAANVLTKEEG